MTKRIGGNPAKRRLLPGLDYPIPITAPQTGAALDDGEGWFGFAQSVVGIVATGAALALSANVAIAQTFDHQDEIATVAASGGPFGSASPSSQRATSATTFQRWFAQDDLPIAPQLALDDVGFTPTKPEPAAFTLPTWDDQVITPHVVDDYWWQPYTVTTTVQPIQWIGDDIVPQPTFYGGAGAASERAVIEPKFRYWFQQDDLPIAAAAVPQEEAGPVLERTRDSATYTVWAENDDIVPQPASLGVDEAYWWTPAPFVGSTLATLFQADDEIVPEPVVSYGGAGAANLRAKAEPRVRYWHSADDFPTPVPFTPPEEDGPKFGPKLDATTYVVYAEDDTIVPQAPSTIGFDADYWLTFPRPPGPLFVSIGAYLPIDEGFPELTAPAPVLTEWRRFAMNRRGR